LLPFFTQFGEDFTYVHNNLSPARIPIPDAAECFQGPFLDPYSSDFLAFYNYFSSMELKSIRKRSRCIVLGGIA
jgi:hypothetical protein